MKFFKPIFLIGCFFLNSAAADKLDSRLIELFDKLYIAESKKEINTLTQDIWKIWDETNDPKIEAYYYRGLEAMRMGDFVMSIDLFTLVIEKILISQKGGTKEPQFIIFWASLINQ